MKRLQFFLLFIFIAPFFIPVTFAQDHPLTFMTSRDLMYNDPTANISLQNNQNSPATVYGLYVRQFGYVAPGDTCNHATSMYSTTLNTAVGSVVTPTTIRGGTSAAVGSNYLYNMIYEALNYVSVYTVTPPPCQLPGCTWGSDSAPYNWCIFMGALAPVSLSTGYTSSVPPSGLDASSGSYNYNLISNYVSLGPISCNDQTLTCAAASRQTQPFS